MQSFARNRHIQELVTENDQLRRKISRQGEMEAYVQSLVGKLEELRGRQEHIGADCARLRAECAQLEDTLLGKENSYREEMRYVFEQHERLLAEKERKLTGAQAGLEQERKVRRELQGELDVVGGRLRKVEEEWRLERERWGAERKSLVGEVEEMGRVVARMKEDNLMMVEYSKEVEGQLVRTEGAVVGVEEENRKVLLKLRDQLIRQEEEFKHENQHLRQQIFLAQEQSQRILHRLQAQQQQHQQNTDQLTKQLTTLQKEHQRAHLQLQDDFSRQIASQHQEHQAAQKQLQEELQLLEDKLAGSQHSRNEAQRSADIVTLELQQVKKLQAHIVSDNETVRQEKQRAEAALTESEKDYNALRKRLNQVELTVERERELVGMEMCELREELGASKRKYEELQRVHLKRVGEYKETMTVNSNLQTLTNKQEVHIKALNKEMQELIEERQQLRDKGVRLQTQKRELLEKVEVEELDRRTLKDLNAKLQDTLEELQGKFISLTGQGRDKGLDQQFLKQMHAMLDNFHQQRSEQNRRHALEKEKMREVYQFSMKERQMQLMRQVFSLEQQLHLSRRFDGMFQRSRHAYSVTDQSL